MTGREVITKTVRFEGPDRLGRSFPEGYGDDFFWTGMIPSVDHRPSAGVDEWGAVWENIGVCALGEVKDFPLKDWSDLDSLQIPDVKDPNRWQELKRARELAGDRFILAGGVSLYERPHFLRGLDNLWIDILAEPDHLERLLDILVEMNLYAVEQYAQAGVNGLIWCDDWGLQERLMIHPRDWRRLWKERYARVNRAAHDAGILTFLHSCGYIVDILDDLIEAGLDVIQMDQQMNMGLELLGERFGGRITFWCPVDIQAVMAKGDLDEIRQYCHELVRHLGRPNGGFLPKWYPDPKGAGHSDEAVAAMCEEFLKIPVAGD